MIKSDKTLNVSTLPLRSIKILLGNILNRDQFRFWLIRWWFLILLCIAQRNIHGKVIFDSRFIYQKKDTLEAQLFRLFLQETLR